MALERKTSHKRKIFATDLLPLSVEEGKCISCSSTLVFCVGMSPYDSLITVTRLILFNGPVRTFWSALCCIQAVFSALNNLFFTPSWASMFMIILFTNNDKVKPIFLGADLLAHVFVRVWGECTLPPAPSFSSLCVTVMCFKCGVMGLWLKWLLGF